MTTALDIITRSLVTINAIQAGETPSAQEAADGLVSLNDLMESLSNEGLTISEVGLESFSLTGSTSYTIGTGGVFNTARPVKVTNAYYTLGGVDYGVDILTMIEYQALSLKSTTGSVVEAIAIDYDYPLAKVYVWPVVSSGTLNLNMDKPFTRFTALTDVLSLQPGFERMLRLNLAAELLPEYMSVSSAVGQDVTAKAMASKANIKRINSKGRVLSCDIPAGRGQRYQIQRGW